MRLSAQGVHLIASFEGFVPHPYNDSAGHATIGYGHLIHYGPVTPDDRKQWAAATPQTLLSLLQGDCASFARAVDHAVTVKLGLIPARAQARFDALVSLAFNIGVEGFRGSHLLELVNRKGAPRDWSVCAPAFLVWDHAAGRVVPGLLHRRQREAQVFVSGRY